MKSVHNLKVSKTDLDEIQNLILLGYFANELNSSIHPTKNKEIEDLFLSIFKENKVKFKGDNFSLDKINCVPNFQENTIVVTSDDLIKL